MRPASSRCQDWDNGYKRRDSAIPTAAASSILSEAGLVMISASNTGPSLTSDLRGNAGVHNHAGFYRTASNDLYQGQAVAEFVYSELGLRRMAAIDDGDPYTSGFTGAFAAAFEELGGAVITAAEISRGDSDMIPVLSRIAADSPEGLFFPVFPGEAAQIARQVGQVEGLEELVLIGSDSLLLAAPEVFGGMRAAVAAVGAVGEGGEEQEQAAAGGEGVAPGAGDAHVGEDAGWTTSSANGAGAASSMITSISTSLTRCANCRLV